jgi:hypothetical protein
MVLNRAQVVQIPVPRVQEKGVAVTGIQPLEHARRERVPHGMSAHRGTKRDVLVLTEIVSVKSSLDKTPLFRKQPCFFRLFAEPVGCPEIPVMDIILCETVPDADILHRTPAANPGEPPGKSFPDFPDHWVRLPDGCQVIGPAVSEYEFRDSLPDPTQGVRSIVENPDDLVDIALGATLALPEQGVHRLECRGDRRD